MRSRRRLYVHWVRLLGALACAVGLSLPSCQFPDYDLPDGNAGGGGKSGGTGASGGSGASGGTAGAPGMGGNGAGAGEAGAGGEPPAPVSSCETVAECAPAVKKGWDGPIAFWLGNWAPDIKEGPPCPDSYGEPTDLHLGLMVTTTGCTCTCAPKDQSCEVTLRVYGDTGCSTECAAVKANSSCVPFSGCSGNQGGMRSDKPTPVGGYCDSDVSSPDDLKWKNDARVCLPVSRAPGLCAESGEACAPTPASPYVTDACVMSIQPAGAATPDCPADYPTRYGPFYTGAHDTRECTACTCGPLTGGECEGKASLTNDTRCPAGDSYQLGEPTCAQFRLPEPPTRVRVDYTLTPGTCGVASPSHVTGDAVVKGSSYTVCCTSP